MTTSNANKKPVRYNITICDGPTCMHKKSKKLEFVIQEELQKRKLTERVGINISGCLGMCGKGPVIIVNPGYAIYGGVTEEDIPVIIEEHILKNKPVTNLIIDGDHLFNRFFRAFGDVSFFGRQMRIALRNCGIIDPENIDDYMALRGYEALAKCLTDMTPDEVIKEVKKSGLRGRGGAGFPTGLKWEFTRKAGSGEKYVICNADEGDPGAFMDRSAIEGDPHTILEGIIIGGYAIGAKKGFIYIRAEYPLAIKRLERAIEDARRHSLLVENILGSDFSFDIEIRLGAGAFVCGEETALIHSIEGSRGMPRPRPPFPSVEGLFGKPTLINNVETWANIPVIILDGAAWFSGIGTEKSDEVAAHMSIPTAHIWGVATFYHYFNLKPVGRHIISVCLGTACYVKGAEKVSEAIKKELGIDIGETTDDKMFTLQEARCLGACGLAPVAMLDGKIYGELTAEKVTALLKKYRSK